MNREDKRENLNKVWDEINESSVDYLKSEFKNIAPKLIEFLVVSLLNQEEIDFGTYWDGKKEGAIVSYDIYNTNKQLTLKMDSKFKLELELMIYDFDGEENIFTYPINEDDLKIIPQGLVNIIIEVVKTKKEKTVFVKSIAQ